MTCVLVADSSILTVADRGAPNTVLSGRAGFACIQTFGTRLTVRIVWADLFVRVPVARSAAKLKAADVAAPVYFDVHCCPIGTARTVVRLIMAETLDVN